jgi:transcriptional regulator with XRE-family HTH domain
MDVCLLIRQRLEELGLEQKDLAAAANVTESYISQLLTRKKMPPAPDHTDIYEKMATLLKLPSGQLSTLAELQRKEELKRRALEPPTPLYKEVRNLVLRKCSSQQREQVQAIFEKQPFGEIERLVTQKLLDVVKTLAREELDNENWLRLFARIRNRRYEEVRVDILEFLDTDVFHVSDEDCVAFLDPLIESWDIDFATFGIEVVLNRRLGPGLPKRFAFVECDLESTLDTEPGLQEFLDDASLSRDVTQEELAFLKRLRFGRLRPTPLYFYREVQSLRDPLHFRTRSSEGQRPPRSKTEAKRGRRKRMAGGG